VLAWTFALCSLLTVFGWLVHAPYFMRLARLNDPAEYDRAGGWPFSSANAAGICAYFLRGTYGQSNHAGVRRHGKILRWSFAIPLVLSIVTLLAMLAMEAVQR
jgi:hypothetical protein